MNFTVVIPSRSVSNLRACLSALWRWDDIPRVIVVDDGLEFDGLEAKYLSERGVTIIAGEKPFIFARNANIGIRAAGEDDVVLMNDDALLESASGLTCMWWALQNRPGVGIISAATNVSNNRAQAPQPGAAVREVPRAVAFVCVLIRRAAITRIGPLDERFTGEIDGEVVYGGEDDDYCYRSRMAGFKVGIYDGCFVNHAALPSTFRPKGGGLPINATRKRFREIHDFEMGMR